MAVIYQMWYSMMAVIRMVVVLMVGDDFVVQLLVVLDLMTAHFAKHCVMLVALVVALVS